MKKLTALLLAIAMMVTCTLCAVAEDGKTYMAVCIASEPDTLDPARTWLSASRPSLIRLTRR